MDTKQAKDFLADQAAQQAALDHVPLSNLEKRMMYFTESDPASCENPVDLDAEFEEQYDTGEYELKISELLDRAHKRLKQENPETRRNWDEAIQTLRKCDHYILVLLRNDSNLARQDLRLSVVLAWGVGLGVALVILMMLGVILYDFWTNS